MKLTKQAKQFLTYLLGIVGFISGCILMGSIR